ncbi:MAG: hypothetical protein JWP91_4574 [Fibrobacteres bacterium]|nr:hypothetical protein [Fibrobacterota bacterium]
MGIEGVGPGTSPTGERSAGKTAGTFRQIRNRTDQSLLSLLPSHSRNGVGSNLDLYAAVGMQTQGLLSRGLTAFQSANASLGINMSERFGDSHPLQGGQLDTSG